MLCALPEELGPLAAGEVGRRTVQGVELIDVQLGPHRLWACVGGVGKVAAAQAASLLLQAGCGRGLLVVGVCGGLRAALAPGTLVHCSRAAQTDLAVRAGREVDSDERLRSAWQTVMPGETGWFLTADRPVLSRWRRLRLARAFTGPCVADMETAAAAAVAQRAGVPWAALRSVTDGATGLALASFKRHFPAQAGRAAGSLEALLGRLEAAEGELSPPG